ncbi:MULTISPECIES: Dabb family protein [unclassified Modestobacter]
MLRHVVLFTWTPETSPEVRAAAVAALRRLPAEVGGMTSFAVGPDAHLVDGNADVALVADFPDVQAFRAYADDPRHLAVLTEHVRPHLASRTAVQYEV